MLSIERKLQDQLKKIVEEYGVGGIKAEFEAEGSSYDDIVRLRHLTGSVNSLPLHVKIGGVEAIRDILDCLEVGVDGVISPMVESAFGAQKFISTIKKYAPNIFHCSVNIETKNGISERGGILKRSSDTVKNITVGRSDLSSSYFDNKIYPDSKFIMENVRSVAVEAKKMGLGVTMGGGLNINTVDCINNTDNLKQLLDFVETRKVIIPVENFLYKPQVLKEALQFEKLYILTKQDYYSRRMREEINRLTDLEGRV